MNFISFDSCVLELQSYLKEHKDFHPDQRKLLTVLLQLEGNEVKELIILSGNVTKKGYDLLEIIPLDYTKLMINCLHTSK